MRAVLGFLAGLAVAVTVPAGAAKVQSVCKEMTVTPPADCFVRNAPVECRKS